MIWMVRALVAFGVMAAIVGWSLHDEMQFRRTAPETYLPAGPTDPRDLFLGYYATINYDFAPMELTAAAAAQASAVCPPEDWREWRCEGDLEVTTVLTAEGEVLADQVFAKDDPAAPAHAFPATPIGPDEDEGPLLVRVLAWQADLPDRYYADRDTAQWLENQVNRGDLVVVLARDGQRSRIKALLVNNERREDAFWR